jgi:hypothetical protein
VERDKSHLCQSQGRRGGSKRKKKKLFLRKDVPTRAGEVPAQTHLERCDTHKHLKYQKERKAKGYMYIHSDTHERYHNFIHKKHTKAKLAISRSLSMP